MNTYIHKSADSRSFEGITSWRSECKYNTDFKGKSDCEYTRTRAHTHTHTQVCVCTRTRQQAQNEHSELPCTAGTTALNPVWYLLAEVDTTILWAHSYAPASAAPAHIWAPPLNYNRVTDWSVLQMTYPREVKN